MYLKGVYSLEELIPERNQLLRLQLLLWDPVRSPDSNS